MLLPVASCSQRNRSDAKLSARTNMLVSLFWNKNWKCGKRFSAGWNSHCYSHYCSVHLVNEVQGQFVVLSSSLEGSVSDKHIQSLRLVDYLWRALSDSRTSSMNSRLPLINLRASWLLFRSLAPDSSLGTKFYFYRGVPVLSTGRGWKLSAMQCQPLSSLSSLALKPVGHGIGSLLTDVGQESYFRTWAFTPLSGQWSRNRLQQLIDMPGELSWTVPNFMIDEEGHITNLTLGAVLLELL